MTKPDSGYRQGQTVPAISENRTQRPICDKLIDWAEDTNFLYLFWYTATLCMIKHIVVLSFTMLWVVPIYFFNRENMLGGKGKLQFLTLDFISYTKPVLNRSVGKTFCFAVLALSKHQRVWEYLGTMVVFSLIWKESALITLKQLHLFCFGLSQQTKYTEHLTSGKR